MTCLEITLSITTLLNAILITVIYNGQLRKQKQSNYIQIAKQLQELYDAFGKVDEGIRKNIDLLFNKSVIGDWKTVEALEQMASDNAAFHKVYSDNRFLFGTDSQNLMMGFGNAAIELRSKLDSLTIAIVTMDFNKMDEVYQSHYGSVHVMMKAFMRNDDNQHPYVEFDKSWGNYQKSATALRNLLDSKKGIAKVI